MGKRKREHDPQTCFRCRLHALQTELHPHGVSDVDAMRILFCTAEVSGILLAQLDDNAKMIFMSLVKKWHDASRQSLEEETRHDAMQTRH